MPVHALLTNKELGRLPVSTSQQSQTAAKEIIVSRTDYPEAAKHIENAQRKHPKVLTVKRSGKAARRREALRGKEPVKGKDRDEYPPAMFEEGGKGASVRPIDSSDNRGAGSCIGNQCRGLPDGAKVKIVVED